MENQEAPTFQKDLKILLVLALARLGLHMLTNGQYGFHRDELAFLSDALHLDWGYVAYPPLTPLIIRGGYELFGTSLIGLRFFSALAQSIAMVLTGLIAREIGGSRKAQVLAVLATGIAPMALIMGAMFQYISFDYLWWVSIAYSVVRLIKTEKQEWWVVIGLGIGLGMLTKYTIFVFVAGLVVGVFATRIRQHLKNKWIWVGALTALLVFLPNLIWQIQNGFISLEFLSSIHDRDVAIGRADGYFMMQFIVSSNPFTVPIWITGLHYLFFKPAVEKYRLIGWMYVIPLILLALMQGRFYYLAPAYPMLLAFGAVAWDGWLSDLKRERLGWRVTWGSVVVGTVVGIILMLPVHPINSRLFNMVSEVHDNFVEQIGWPDLVESVAGVYLSLSEDEQSRTGILTGNYGEAGAIEVYGPGFGLPQPISSMNSFWMRGYGDPAPENILLVGFTKDFGDDYFESCEWAAKVTNQYSVRNEESEFHPDIYLCHNLIIDWEEFWIRIRSFG